MTVFEDAMLIVLRAVDLERSSSRSVSCGTCPRRVEPCFSPVRR